MARIDTLPAAPAQRDDRTVAAALWVVVGAAAAAAGLLVGLSVGGAAYTPATDGLPDPGPIVGWGLPVASILTVVCGTLTIGFLTAAAFLLPVRDRAVVSRAGRADLVRAAVAAGAWSLSAVATLTLTHARAIGEPLLVALRPDVFWTYAFEVDQNVAYLITALLAGVICVTATLATGTGTAAALTGVAAVAIVAAPVTAHGTTLGDHSLAITASAVHALAAALWVGGLVAVGRHALRRDEGLAVAVRRFSSLALACVVALVVSGIGNTYVRLEQPSDLVTTGYGVLVLAKVALLAVVVTVASRTRRSAVAEPLSPARLVQWLLTEALLLAVTIGLAVSLTLTPFPRADVPLPTLGEQLLGFPYPAPPTGADVLLGWYPDALFLLLAALLAGGYGWGLWRVRSRGVRWFPGRAVAWYAGVVLLVAATSGGLAGYAQVSVLWHMVQHMVVSMLVPILLVLGMPVTLALRALRPGRGDGRGPREWLLWVLHSGVSRLVSHPLWVLAIGTFGLFGLYFTPLFASAMSSHLGHIAMGLHFLASGFLFYWVVLALDPGPREVPAWARLLLLLVYVSLHAFFAVAIMMSTQPLAPEWFGQVQPPWLTDAVRDTVDAGGIAWGFGEIPAVLVMVVVAVQWARSEERVARRRDRQADRDGDAELAAYNARLAAMAARAERTKH